MGYPKFRLYFLHPRFWSMWAGLAVLWLCVQLPYAWILKIGKGFGWLIYWSAKGRRRIAHRNLVLCFPDWSAQQRHQVLRESFYSTGIALVETAMSWWWPKARLQSLVHVEGLEHLLSTLDQGQGVILMAVHFTTLEIGAALLGQYCSIDGMYREHTNPVFDWVQHRGRERHNSGAKAIRRNDVRAMVRSLRQKRAIWYAPDQDYGRRQSLFVPFFGVQAATVTATSRFARLGHAKVVPFTQERLPHGQGYRLTLHPPLENFPGPSDAADCLRINQWAERVICQTPGQYLWAHRRFKTRPRGELSLYSPS